LLCALQDVMQSLSLTHTTFLRLQSTTLMEPVKPASSSRGAPVMVLVLHLHTKNSSSGCSRNILHPWCDCHQNDHNGEVYKLVLWQPRQLWAVFVFGSCFFCVCSMLLDWGLPAHAIRLCVIGTCCPHVLASCMTLISRVQEAKLTFGSQYACNTLMIPFGLHSYTVPCDKFKVFTGNAASTRNHHRAFAASNG